mmetsp:Transcript_65264/g.151445  ORF Transcript_65264/g.151445 Transcript_65264/m.151445 type:complete len:185 (+) Transcript_65264:69-623(+)|eukprot:CAMPEP_0171097166 /NCGR_PEP_ID=MMETSP0766_2-20121228/47136_1 /TAXON_ID=439317 /ORGANISM="Gambierdiscus australes, Strain CAWD 149" /LENGTH=184 /DNA_ID=CAMNT_0011556315 /DNA_START=68 /DNA_END=622 /DNA_ORIENTATION=-
MSYLKTDYRTEAELLNRTRRTLAQAEEISTQTLGALHSQTEQLQRIQADADAVGHKLDQSERLIQSMKPFGWLRDMFRSDPPRRNSKLGASAGAPSAGAARLAADEIARRNSNSSNQGAERQASEVDRAYSELDQMLESLKHKGKEINRTLDQHNQMLPQIAETVHRDDERMQKQRKELAKRSG